LAVHHFLFAFGHLVLHLDLGSVVCHREDEPQMVLDSVIKGLWHRPYGSGEKAVNGEDMEVVPRKMKAAMPKPR
jgi:hypothetical protein